MEKQLFSTVISYCLSNLCGFGEELLLELLTYTQTQTHTHAHTRTNCIMKLTWDEGRILISKTALIIVFLFCISYLCEVAFSALLFIKSKYRSTANSLDPTVLQIVLILYIMATYTNIWYTILNFEKIS